MGYMPVISGNEGLLTTVIGKWRRQPRLIDALHSPVVVPTVHVNDRVPFSLLNNKFVQQVAPLFKDSAPRSEVEQKAFAELQRVSLGGGLAVGGLFLPPLQIAATLCLVPTMSRAFKAAYNVISRERRVSGDVMNAVYLTGVLAGGFWFQLSVGAWFLVFVRWLAIRTEDQSKQGIIDLFGQQIHSVWQLVDGVEVEVPVAQVQVGDLIVIQAAQMVPLDGIIVEGHASIDQRMLTGEAQPAEKGPGDAVLAATIVLAGRICLRVEHAGAETVAAQIGRVLTDTRSFKANLVSRTTAFNDQMALPYLLLSGFALPFIGLNRALAVIMGMPAFRMVLYGPLSMLSYLHVAARKRILLKDGRSLEALRTVDTVVFDKTGTLTLEQPQVCAIHAYGGFSERDVLTYAAAAETKQTHPIARAILAAAAEHQVVLPTIDDAAYELGYGIQVNLNGQLIRVGSARFLALHAITLPPVVEQLQSDVHHAGQSLVLVAANEQLVGAIVLQPTLRPEIRQIVTELQARHLQLYIISGDHHAPTQRLAEQLGLNGYFAEVLPEAKADLVKQLQAEGRNVCFVGDGINDAIALKSANVSVSLHGATTIATDTAQIVLMDGDLTQLAATFTLADEFADNMRVNYYAAILPSIIITGGALFGGLSLLPCIILNNLPVPFAFYNTIRPLMDSTKELEEKEQGEKELSGKELRNDKASIQLVPSVPINPLPTQPKEA